jgi:hypothetical protein
LKKEKRYKKKGTHNIFNKIITENFSNLVKTMPTRDRKPLELQADLTKIELPHDILSLKQQVQRLEKEY